MSRASAQGARSPATVDLDSLIAECLVAARTASPGEAVRDVLARALYAGIRLRSKGAASHQRVAILHLSDELTVLHVVITPAAVFLPHDHGLWAATALLTGREDNVFYRREGRRVVQGGGRRQEAGELLLTGPEVIHSLSNPGRTPSASIRVFGGDLTAVPRWQWSPPTYEASPLDPGRLAANIALRPWPCGVAVLASGSGQQSASRLRRPPPDGSAL